LHISIHEEELAKQELEYTLPLQINITNNNTSSDRILAAAEVLVNAASMEADSMTQQQLSSNLESLKRSLDSNLNTMCETMKTSNDNLYAQINTVNKNLTSLNIEVSSLKMISAQQASDLANHHKLLTLELVHHNKLRTLEWAFKNADFISFRYYRIGDCDTQHKSSDFIRAVIFSFREGKGHYFDTNAYFSYSDNNDGPGHYESEPNDAYKKEWKDKIANDIHRLIGKKPRVAKNTIYFE